MAKLKRSAIVALMNEIGFETASALSTGRLQKKVNRLNKIEINEDKLDDRHREVLSFILDSIEDGTEIEIDDDRPNIPLEERPKVQKTGLRGTSRKFDSSAKESKYKWNEILNGSIVEMTQGADYDCKSTTFGMQVRSAARRRGVEVRVSVQQGRVIVQAVK